MATSSSPENPNAPLLAKLRVVTRALRHRNFRLFIAGQSFSLIGTWVQVVAQSWLVYRLSGSPFMLGLVGFASQIPFLLLAPAAGVAADRMNRRRLIVLTQALATLQAVLLAVLTLTGAVQVWQVFYLAMALGAAIILTRSHADAADAIQDALLSAWQGLESRVNGGDPSGGVHGPDRRTGCREAQRLLGTIAVTAGH